MRTAKFTAPAQITKEMDIPIPSYWMLKHQTEFARTGVAVLNEDTAVITAFIRSQTGQVTYAGTVLQALSSVRGFADGSLSECTEKEYNVLKKLAEESLDEFIKKNTTDANSEHD